MLFMSIWKLKKKITNWKVHVNVRSISQHSNIHAYVHGGQGSCVYTIYKR